MKDKIKSFLSRTKHMKGTVLLIMLSLIMAYFAIFLGVSFRRNMAYEYYDSIDYQYKYSKSFIYSGSDIQEILKKPISGCNFTVRDIYAYSESNNEARGVDVIVHYENPIYPFVEGGFPKSDEIADKLLVILGINIKPYCREENGKYYYMLQNEEYEVAGFISTGRSVAFDYDIIVFFENMGENLKQQLWQQTDSAVYTLESNSGYVDAAYEQLTNSAPNAMEMPGISRGASSVPNMSEEKYTFLLYLFAFMSVVVSVTLWLDRRTHELSIRKTYGYSYVEIFFLVLRELSVYTLSGCVLSFIMVLGFNQIFSELSTEFHTNLDWLMAVGMLAATQITAFLVTIVHMLRFIVLKPIELLHIRR